MRATTPRVFVLVYNGLRVRVIHLYCGKWFGRIECRRHPDTGRYHGWVQDSRDGFRLCYDYASLREGFRGLHGLLRRFGGTRGRT